jgi:predicted transcriptional regulator
LVAALLVGKIDDVRPALAAIGRGVGPPREANPEAAVFFVKAAAANAAEWMTMATNEKQPRGRPRLKGQRPSFTFRIQRDMKERLAKMAERDRRSLSEQAELTINIYFQFEENREFIEEAKLEAQARISAAVVNALRLAGLMILRESGRARRVIVDFDALLAEADGLLHGLRGGFFDDEAPAPATLTDAEVERREEEIEKAIETLRRKTAPKKPDEKVA